jgi:site-specific DNA recombinase
MSRTKSSEPAPERAALYFRMSKDEQEHSIARQEGQVRPYLARLGYALAAEYRDEGIAGWKSGDDRPDFRRMLQDAQRGLFDVILCDDVDRFGRFDMHKYGAVVDGLRQAGVRLETVAQGPIDWDDTFSQLNDAVRMVFKREQSNDTSRRILTRFVLMARQGMWVTGTVPYGYALDGATRRLVPGDPHAVEVVRWLFKTYAEKDVSLRWLVEELHRRGVRNPSGKPNAGNEYRWSPNCLAKMLRNRNYLGDLHWNKTSNSEFQSVEGGQVVKRKKRGRRRRGEADLIITPNSHPALIDRETFERVQARLEGNRERTTPHLARGGILLSGLMVCGHCGARMVGKNSWHRDTKDRKPVYICNGYQRWGKSACGCHYVFEADVLDVLVRKLQDEYLNPDNLAMQRADLRRQAEAANREGDGQTDRLRRQAEALERDIAQANVNMARAASAEAVEGIAQVVRLWRAERDAILTQLAEADTGRDLAALEAELDMAERQLWQLREGLEKDDPADVRAVLGEMIDRVELWWEHRQVGRYSKARFSRGLIYLRADEQLLSCHPYQCSGTGMTAPRLRPPSRFCARSAKIPPSSSARPSPVWCFRRRMRSRSAPS